MVFKDVSQKSPLYAKTVASGSNKIDEAGSLKSDALKWEAKICHACNTTRTQPYDQAWEKLSAHLQNYIKEIKHKKKLKLQSVYPGSVKRSMLHLHLYFLKMFGCIINEHNVPIPIDGFSKSVLNNIAHPNVYISFGFRDKLIEKGIVLITQIESVTDEKTGLVHFACWNYCVKNVIVDVIYSIDDSYTSVVREFWHPNETQKIMKLSELKNNLQAVHKIDHGESAT